MPTNVLYRYPERRGDRIIMTTVLYDTETGQTGTREEDAGPSELEVQDSVDRLSGGALDQSRQPTDIGAQGKDPWDVPVPIMDTSTGQPMGYWDTDQSGATSFRRADALPPGAPDRAYATDSTVGPSGYLGGLNPGQPFYGSRGVDQNMGIYDQALQQQTGGSPLFGGQAVTQPQPLAGQAPGAGAPVGGAAATPGTPGSAIAPAQFAGLQGADNAADVFRNAALFNPDNPAVALNNALRKQGIDPGNAGNPFVQFIQRAAPGLALAFNIAQAQNPAMQGLGAATSNPAAFQEFITGGLQKGNIFSGLANAAQQIPSLVDAIRARGAAGTDVTQQNPFLELINQTLGRNFGEGTIDTLAGLLTPMMPKTLGSAYAGGLANTLARAQYDYDYSNQNTDIWRYILSKTGPGSAPTPALAGAATAPTTAIGAAPRPLLGGAPTGY